jgi:hypothetical protein
VRGRRGRASGDSRAFGEAFAALRYERASWFAAVEWKRRHAGGSSRPEFFADQERTLSLFIGKSLR